MGSPELFRFSANKGREGSPGRAVKDPLHHPEEITEPAQVIIWYLTHMTGIKKDSPDYVRALSNMLRSLVEKVPTDAGPVRSVRQMSEEINLKYHYSLQLRLNQLISFWPGGEDTFEGTLLPSIGIVYKDIVFRIAALDRFVLGARDRRTVELVIGWWEGIDEAIDEVNTWHDGNKIADTNGLRFNQIRSAIHRLSRNHPLFALIQKKEGAKGRSKFYPPQSVKKIMDEVESFEQSKPERLRSSKRSSSTSSKASGLVPDKLLNSIRDFMSDRGKYPGIGQPFNLDLIFGKKYPKLLKAAKRARRKLLPNPENGGQGRDDTPNAKFTEFIALLSERFPDLKITDKIALKLWYTAQFEDPITE